MKKLLFIAAFFTGFASFSQTDENTLESKLICKNIDEFTDKVTLSNIELALAYEDGGDMSSEGLLAMLFLSEGKNGTIEPSTLYIKVLGINGCVDTGSTLDVIFENGEKIRLTNWKKFDCDGKNYFKLSKKNIDLFKTSKVKAVKYTNSRNYDTMVIKENIGEMNSYLMDILLEIDKVNNKEVRLTNCVK